METPKSSLNSCPKCRKPTPRGALAGLCPVCLLAQATEIESKPLRERAPFKPLEQSEVARLFPSLEILGLIGAGGMGAVYKARQRVLDRLVALKILPPQGDDGVKFAERFNREARALARLSHPNIVAVYEFGQTEGHHFFIMEFVDGANLRQLERSGRLSPREALQIIPQICDALQYAHDEGVVHRDIKPENVLVDRRGKVKIADFGLAKILGQSVDEHRLTAEGQVMGTPHYMAPEQLERPLAVDHRADIYSLGVVFYEMLTGDLPLGKFSPPSSKVQVDVRLDAVVLRALENDPERRYQQVGEVKTQVETITETPAPPMQGSASEPKRAGRSYLHWAGFPVVVEFDGSREVNWNGALSAIAAGLFCVAIGALLVRMFTGESNVPGMVPLGSMTAVFIVMAGIRRTLNAETSAEPVRDGDDSRLLPSWKNFRRRDALSFGAIILFVIGWNLFCIHVVRPNAKDWFGSSGVKVDQTAVRDPQTEALVAALPGGGKIELLAIGHAGSAPDGWWSPDGNRITNSQYTVRGSAVSGDSTGQIRKDFLFRVSGLADGAARLGYEVEPASSIAAGGRVFRDRRPLDGAGQVQTAWKPGTRRATIRSALGLEPWRTIATESLIRQSGTREQRPTDPHWTADFQRPPYGATGDAQISIVFGPKDVNWQHQVVAVDTNDVEHGSSSGQCTPLERSELWTYAFRGMPYQSIKEFRLQVRPVHWVEFRNVALEPRTAVPEPKPMTFDPVREVIITDWIDFDLGITTDPSLASSPLDASKRTAWAKEHGFDASAGVGELVPIEMEFVALGNEEWDRLSASETMERFYSGSIYRPRTLKPLVQGKLPATFAFLTREHGVGLLQLFRFDSRHPEATVRYKLVTGTSSAPYGHGGAAVKNHGSSMPFIAAGEAQGSTVGKEDQ